MSPTIKPMLAEEYDQDTILYPVYVQPKLNGIRALYHPKLQAFQTRDGKWWDRKLTKVFSDSLIAAGHTDAILDGEFYSHGLPLQQIAGAMSVSRLDISADHDKITYHVYDMVSSRPFSERKEFIHTVRMNGRQISGVPVTFARNHFELETSYDYWINNKYEGVMIRLGSAPYIHGRTSALLKRKPLHSFEARVIGVLEGKGQHVGRLGAFEVESLDGKLKYKVGGGLTIPQRDKWWANPPIGMVITVETKAGVSAGGIPVQAHFVTERNYE